jgi:glycosyltransferase involved in cell wall biosynthesis
LASEKEAKISNSLLIRNKGLIEYCPFPLDTHFYTFNPHDRIKVRKRLGLKSSDRLIIYTGRISLQKNVHLMLQEFVKITQQSNKEIYFYIVGSYDDLGGDVTGLLTPLGWYYQKIKNALAEVPQEVRQRIRFFKFLGAEEIRELLTAADLYWAMSLHHNEDFGMSVAEALSLGLPAVVTDWAGYSSFARDGIDCGVANVRLGKKGSIYIDSDSFVKKSLKYLEQDRDSKIYLNAANNFKQHFSVKAVGLKLKAIDKNDYATFSGFKNHVKDLPKKLFIDMIPSKKSFYEKIYKGYFS